MKRWIAALLCLCLLSNSVTVSAAPAIQLTTDSVYTADTENVQEAETIVEETTVEEIGEVVSENEVPVSSENSIEVPEMTVVTDGTTEAAAEESSEETDLMIQEVQNEADTFEVDTLYYQVLSEENKTAVLTGVDRTKYSVHGGGLGKAAEITVPSTVEHDGVTYSVTEIGEFAFADYTFDAEYGNPLQGYDVPVIGEGELPMPLYVDKIIVSDGVKKIGAGAFYRIFQLDEVVLPDSVEEIGMAAFYLDSFRIGVEEYGEPLVWEVNIPKNVKTIGAYAYSGVNFAGTLVIPNGVTTIGEYAFGWEDTFNNYSVVDVPASVTTIGENAFHISSLVKAVLRTTSMPDIDTWDSANVYNAAMFGEGYVSNLVIYVPADLIENYESSCFQYYLSNCQFRDITGYVPEETTETETFHFAYGGEKITQLDIKLAQTIYVSVEMDNDVLTCDDIVWELEVTDGLENTSTDPSDYLEFTDDGAGTLTLKAKKPGYLRLVGKVSGYENVMLEISNLYTTENEAIAFIERMNALSANEIEAQKVIRTDMGTSQQIAEIREKAEEITKNCTTDREKIFAIEQWLAGHIAYDYDYLQYYEDGTGFIKSVPYGAYEVLQNHFTVCGGFSNLAEAMLRSIGIPCVQIFGLASDTPDNKATDHAWNAAYDGDAGKWIYFDATWDSTSMLSGSYFTSGEPNTEWFDYNAEEACKKRFIADSTLDRENDPDYKPVNYVKSNYITLYVGETRKLDFLEGVEYSSLVAKGDYLEWDSDFVSYGYEKVKKEETFFTVDDSGNVTGVKAGMGTIVIDGYYEVPVRVFEKVGLTFEKDCYKVVPGSSQSVEVLQADVPVTGLMKYTSDDTSVVTIDENGVLTPVALGTASITGHFYCNDSYTVSCTVEVVESVAEETTTFELDDLIYEVDTKPQGDVPGTVSVIGESFGNLESSRSITVTIPETVTYDGDTYTVTRIGPEAFTNLIGNATVTIPASVKRIERKAFYGPRSRPGTELTGELVFPKDSQLEYIGFYAFADNPQLTKVDLSNCTKLHTIEDYAFSSCSYSSTTVEGALQTIGITEVILPESVKEIGELAFYLSQNLTTINIPKNMDYIGYGAFAFTDLAGVVDLSGVKDMDEQVFFRVFDLKGFILNDDWTEIPDGLFAGASVEWAASKSLVEAAGGADKVEYGSLLLSEKVTHIGEEAFSGCGYITKVQAPGVVSVEKRAFANCISVENFDFEQNLTVIPEKAFINCNALKEFTLNKDVTEIGYGALYGLNNITDMYIYSEKIDTFGSRCLPTGIRVYIPLSVSERYMKALESYNVEFYDLDGKPIGTAIIRMEAYLKDYPIYKIGDPYDIIRDAICVYVEYSDNTFREVADFNIELGTFQSGRQEITITYGKYTDTIVVGECENTTPVYALDVDFEDYIYPVYKVGDSFQKIREELTVSVILNENFQKEEAVKQVVHNYDISPGFFKEGYNEITITYCDYIRGMMNITSVYLEATVTGEEPKPEEPPIEEGVITGLWAYNKIGTALDSPKAGYVVQKEDLIVEHIVEKSTGIEYVETTDYTITNGNLKMGENTLVISSHDSDGKTITSEIFIWAEAKADALDVKLKKGVKLKVGDVSKTSQFTATVSYVGENGYKDQKEVTDFVIVSDATIRDGMNVLKFSYTETTFAYGTVTQEAEWSMCTDDKPVLSTTSLTINQYAVEESSFKVYMPFGMTAGLDGILYKNNKGAVQDGLNYTVSEDGLCTVHVPAIMKNKTYSLFVKVQVEETENTYFMPIKISLKTTLPKITVTAEALNLFYTDEESRTLDLTVKNPSAEVITAVAFEENSSMDQYFDVLFDEEKQTLALKMTNSTATKKNIVKSGKLLIYTINYNKPVSVSVKVSVSDKQPKLKITPTAVTVNTLLYDSRESSFEVNRQEGKTYVPVSLSGTEPEIVSFSDLFDDVDAENNNVTLTWKNSADFNKIKTVKVKLQASNWKQPITVSYKIKTVSVLPKAVLNSKTLSLDMRAVGAETETILRFDTKPGDITYTDLPENVVAVKNNDKAPEVTLEKIDEVTYIARASWQPNMQKGSYKYDIIPKLSDGTEMKKVSLTVKVSTSNKAASATWKAQKGSMIELTRRDSTKYVYGITPTVKGTFIKEAVLKDVKLGNVSVENNPFDVKVNMQNDVVETVEIAASEEGVFAAGKKYKLVFAVTPATEAEELASAEVSITVTPKESTLKLNANVKSATLYRNILGMTLTYKVTPKTTGVKIAEMKYVPDSKVPEGAFDIKEIATGSYEITIKDRTKVAKNKEYLLKFSVLAEGGSKTVTQTVKIKVK